MPVEVYMGMNNISKIQKPRRMRVILLLVKENYNQKQIINTKFKATLEYRNDTCKQR